MHVVSSCSTRFQGLRVDILGRICIATAEVLDALSSITSFVGLYIIHGYELRHSGLCLCGVVLAQWMIITEFSRETNYPRRFSIKYSKLSDVNSWATYLYI